MLTILLTLFLSIANAQTIFGDLKLKGHVILENEKQVRLSEATANGTNYVALKAPSSLSSDYTFILPTDYGTNGYVLQTNGSGTLSWVAQGGGVTADSTTTFTNKTIDADDNSISDIDNSEIKDGANIGLSKLAPVSANRVLVSDVSGFVSASALTDSELNILTGLSGTILTDSNTVTSTNKTFTSPVIGTAATFTNNASAQFFEATGNGSNKITVAAPSSLSGDVTFTLPDSNGTNGHVLQTNGSGVTSWVAQSGGGSPGLYCTISWGYGLNAYWFVSASSFTDPALDNDYPTPTVTNTTLGTAAGVTCSAPGTKVPQLVTSSLPAGEYKVTTAFTGSSDSTNRCYSRLTDGTTNGFPLGFGGNAASRFPLTNTLDVVYGSTSSPTFKFQMAASTVSGCYVTNGESSGVMEATIYLYRVR